MAINEAFEFWSIRTGDGEEYAAYASLETAESFARWMRRRTDVYPRPISVHRFRRMSQYDPETGIATAGPITYQRPKAAPR